MDPKDTPAAATEIDHKTLLEFKKFDYLKSRIHEVFLTFRVVVICVAIGFSIWCICWAVVRITDKPWWEILIFTLTPAGFVGLLWEWFYKWSERGMKKIQNEITQNEQNTQDKGE